MNADPTLPTAEEQALIGQGIFISKLKDSNQNYHPTYHRWRDVWDDNLCFTVIGLDQAIVWRAMAISMPCYYRDDQSVDRPTYRAFVYGVVLDDGGVAGQPFEFAQIIWKK
ncbi:MAG: hypothetical protein PHN75_05355 [Syntrophales bacterium]|nr:hypothetical protein [Syntrophales bacterium]